MPSDSGPARLMKTSSQEASRAEDLQHELVERDRRVRAKERQRVLRAVRLQLLAVLLVLLLVRLEQRLRDGHLARVTGLAIDEREVTMQVRRGLTHIVDLEHERLELVIAQR